MIKQHKITLLRTGMSANCFVKANNTLIQNLNCSASASVVLVFVAALTTSSLAD